MWLFSYEKENVKKAADNEQEKKLTHNVCLAF
jgi:hypothetical protein